MNYLTPFLLSTLLLLTACGADDSSPTSVVYDEGEDIELNADRIAKPRLALGFNHSCFITADNGSVMCWGANHLGQLGNGENIVPDEDAFFDEQIEFVNTLNSSKPLSVVGVTEAIEISASENHTCALLTAGNVKCWGSNSNGQLGNSQLSTQGKKASSTAVEVTDLQGAKSISVGNNYSCVLLEDNSIKCWGTLPSKLFNDKLLAINSKNPAQLATASSHACATVENKQIQCWGDRDNGKLGHTESTEQVVTGIDKALLISSKGNHSCALLNNGRVECWGFNLNGQIGNGLGDLNSVLTPNRVRNLSQVISLSSGEQYNCAATVAGQVLCWGNNQHGQLGYISRSNRPDVRPFSPRPEIVVGISTAKEVSASQSHSCVRLENDDIYCWGKNDLGQLGNGKKLNFDDKRTPQSISSTPVKVNFN